MRESKIDLFAVSTTLMATAMAFVIWFICDPYTTVRAYGEVLPKVSVLLLLFSTLFGIYIHMIASTKKFDLFLQVALFLGGLCPLILAYLSFKI